ncbi:hypothetical protein LZ575_11705 [Antarcticibacterium sp. 1MA-6-2]|uniref:hypothetical protein n=1 Tax=Antarcticibacterium sp. 1MA-6-2 TaxID=2908210 RepID=UPI001F425789|nr:hypothetical protein [Antarcticibacterium sp. 1MA-6-2]UJH89722.1 hypothetical protein LZ575_11705 [Antarcticibacterium sp. 1MA-6-2]
MPAVYVVESNSGFRLFRNGEAFIIKGAAAHPKYMEELKAAGANTVRIYDTLHLKQTLDKAANLGLAVVLDIPLPSYSKDPQVYEDAELFKDLRENVLLTVMKYKDHPSLLYWNLGNEIKYPEFYKNLNFFSNYRSLVDDIHNEDGEHPVSTTVAGASRRRTRSMILRETNLDFYSFNIFGGISTFPDQLGVNKYFWEEKYVISEWGINGPWENGYTAWKAPIEETSTKKAEQIRERYYNYLLPLEKEGSLGNLVFYWGKKNEITPTWFSFFGENSEKTQVVFELEKIWKNSEGVYQGPKLKYLLLNGKGALENVILLPGIMAEAEVVLTQQENQDLNYGWEIRKESWFVEDESVLLDNLEHQKMENKVFFKVPKEEGAYRLYVYLTNTTEYIATANFPFYVLNTENGE